MSKYNVILGWLQRLQLQSKAKSLVSATGGTITAEMALSSGGAIVANIGASGATTFALPPAKKGMRVTALVQAAQELRLDPNGTETLSGTDGVQGAAGKYIGADAVGERIVYVVIVDGQWHVVSSNGTWTIQS